MYQITFFAAILTFEAKRIASGRYDIVGCCIEPSKKRQSSNNAIELTNENQIDSNEDLRSAPEGHFNTAKNDTSNNKHRELKAMKESKEHKMENGDLLGHGRMNSLIQ